MRHSLRRAGVVNQRVDAAPFGEHGLDDSAAIRVLGDIAAKLLLARVARHARHLPAALCQFLRGRLADSRCPSGHDRHLLHASSRIRSAAFSATAITAALMFPDGTAGITEASTTRRPETPLTRRLSSTTEPMLHVDVGWNTVTPVSRQ